MKVKVTKQDIIDGQDSFHDTCGCPVWNALYRALGLDGWDESGFEIFKVSEARIGKICFRLPESAIQFQRRGMAGKPVKPFTFETKPQFNSKVRVRA